MRGLDCFRNRGADHSAECPAARFDDSDLDFRDEFPSKELDRLRSRTRNAMILLDLPISREYFLSVFQDLDVRPNVAERTSELSIARSLVANGFGFSLFNMQPKTKLAPDGGQLAFVRLTDSIRPLTLGLATKQIEYRSRIVDAFFNHMKELVETNRFPGIVLPKV